MKYIILCETRLASMGNRDIAKIWLEGNRIRYEAVVGKEAFVDALVTRWRKNGIVGADGECYKPKDGEMFLEALKMKYSGVFLQAFEEGAD